MCPSPGRLSWAQDLGQGEGPEDLSLPLSILSPGDPSLGTLKGGRAYRAGVRPQSHRVHKQLPPDSSLALPTRGSCLRAFACPGPHTPPDGPGSPLLHKMD